MKLGMDPSDQACLVLFAVSALTFYDRLVGRDSTAMMVLSLFVGRIHDPLRDPKDDGGKSGQ